MTPEHLKGKVTTLVDKADYDAIGIENERLRTRLADFDRYAHANKVQAEEIKALRERLAEAELSRDSWKREAELNQAAADECAGYSARAAEAEARLAEAEALRKDAERWRELESVGRQYRFPSIWGGTVWRDSSNDYNGSRYTETREIFARREAIDAAMGEKP